MNKNKKENDALKYGNERLNDLTIVKCRNMRDYRTILECKRMCKFYLSTYDSQQCSYNVDELKDIDM
jgi:hypothetical protein